jgi:hypothetical protein
MADFPKTVQAISAPPAISRAVVSVVVFFSLIPIPKAVKNKSIDDMPNVEMPNVEMPNGFLSIVIGKNPWVVVSAMYASAIWISNRVMATIANKVDIWCLLFFI